MGKTQVKTTLVPGAPWPYPPQLPKVEKIVKPKVKKPKSRIDENFEHWRQKADALDVRRLSRK